MLLQNFLYFLEHCIPLRDQYILGSYCKLTHSSIFVYNIQLKLHTFFTTFLFCILCTCLAWHPYILNRRLKNCIEHGLKPVCKYQVCPKSWQSWLNNPNETVCIHLVIIGKPSCVLCVCVNLKWIKKKFHLYCPDYIDGKTALSEIVHDPYGVLEWTICYWARFVCAHKLCSLGNSVLTDV